jgi:hypothetical protein
MYDMSRQNSKYAIFVGTKVMSRKYMVEEQYPMVGTISDFTINISDGSQTQIIANILYNNGERVSDTIQNLVFVNNNDIDMVNIPTNTSFMAFVLSQTEITFTHNIMTKLHNSMKSFKKSAIVETNKKLYLYKQAIQQKTNRFDIFRIRQELSEMIENLEKSGSDHPEIKNISRIFKLQNSYLQ